MTAPPPIVPALLREPIVINKVPTKITANAMKNSHVAIEKGGTVSVLCATGTLAFALQLMQDQIEGSKQLPHTVRPHDWQT